jgi:hypothetical protein
MNRWLRATVAGAVFLATAAAASAQGQIDWEKRVLRGSGVGAPDLNAPSIAVARLSAERAAMAAAQRSLFDALSAAPLQSGGTAGALLQKDDALRAKVQAKLRGARPVKTHYFSDGGISLELQMPLDQLPPEIGSALKEPAQTAASPAAAAVDAGIK